MTVMTPGRAALLGLMHRYLGALMDPFITLLEVHKLMYFLQEAGEPLRLRFVKGPLGPIAEDLRHALEGHLTAGDAADVNAPGEHLSLAPGAIGSAEQFLAEHAATRERFDRVVRLVEGFETPFGLELLASVHWALTREPVKSWDDLVQALYTWGPQQRQFSPMQIGLAADRLRQEGWLP